LFGVQVCVFEDAHHGCIGKLAVDCVLRAEVFVIDAQLLPFLSADRLTSIVNCNLR
jgi:hypothetical protein